MSPLLYYSVLVIVAGNVLLLMAFLFNAWRKGVFKKRSATPLAALEVQQDGKILYVEFSRDGKPLSSKCVGHLDAVRGQAILKRKQGEALSPADLVAYIDANGQSFWEKFPGPVQPDPEGLKTATAA